MRYSNNERRNWKGGEEKFMHIIGICIQRMNMNLALAAASGVSTALSIAINAKPMAIHFVHAPALSLARLRLTP